MTLSIFSRITAFFLASFAVGIYFRGYPEFTFLLLFITALLIIPKKFWVALGARSINAWNYVAPKAHAVGGKAANHTRQVAHQASNGFQAAQWFWSGVVTGVLGIGFLLGAAWNESAGTLQVSGVLFTLSAICFITYYNWWRPLGRWLAKAIDFLGKQALKIGGWATRKFFKHPLYTLTTIFVALFISSHYFDWSAGDKWLWGVLAFVFTWASVVTARGKRAEFWKITFGSPRPILISTGTCFFFIGFFTKAFVPGGLGELLATFGVCLILVGTVGIAMWNKVTK